MIYGLELDLSCYQQSVDWTKINTPISIGGVQKVVTEVNIKTSEGAGVIDYMAANHAMHAAEEKLIIGYYHFCRPYPTPSIEANARTQAQFFWKCMSNIQTKATVPPCLDLEANDANLSPADYLAWVNFFIAELKGYGYKDVIIYGAASFLNIHLPINHGLGVNALWVAEYDIYEPQLHIPIGWSDWAYWQFTDTGKHPAVYGNVDMSFIKGAVPNDSI